MDDSRGLREGLRNLNLAGVLWWLREISYEGCGSAGVCSYVLDSFWGGVDCVWSVSGSICMLCTVWGCLYIAGISLCNSIVYLLAIVKAIILLLC